MKTLFLVLPPPGEVGVYTEVWVQTAKHLSKVTKSGQYNFKYKIGSETVILEVLVFHFEIIVLNDCL